MEGKSESKRQTVPWLWAKKAEVWLNLWRVSLFLLTNLLSWTTFSCRRFLLSSQKWQKEIFSTKGRAEWSDVVNLVLDFGLTFNFKNGLIITCKKDRIYWRRPNLLLRFSLSNEIFSSSGFPFKLSFEIKILINKIRADSKSWIPISRRYLNRFL